MVEFTVGTMQKLVELLRPPEPEILQGEDLPSAGEFIDSCYERASLSSFVTYFDRVL